MSEHFTASRVKETFCASGASGCSIEVATDYTDGYRITVGWVEEDQTWYARLTGTKAEDGPLGHGNTKEAALLDLCCALACLADTLVEPLPSPAPAPGEEVTAELKEMEKRIVVHVVEENGRPTFDQQYIIGQRDLERLMALASRSASEDTERVNWLQEQVYGARPEPDIQPIGTVVLDGTWTELHCHVEVGAGLYAGHGATLREAIDAARRAPDTETKV